METALPESIHKCKLCLRVRAAVAPVGWAGGAAAGMVEAGRGFESRDAHINPAWKNQVAEADGEGGGLDEGPGSWWQETIERSRTDELTGAEVSTQLMGSDRGEKQLAFATRASICGVRFRRQSCRANVASFPVLPAVRGRTCRRRHKCVIVFRSAQDLDSGAQR